MDDKPVCAGLFGPCSNPPDDAYRLDDPSGEGPPVHRCRTCAEAGDRLFQRIIDEGKVEKFAFEIEAAERRTSGDRGKS